MKKNERKHIQCSETDQALPRWQTGWIICQREKQQTGFWATTTTGGLGRGIIIILHGNILHGMTWNHGSSKIWMWCEINSQCTLEEEDMLRFGAGNMDGFNMIGLLLPGVAVTYNGEEIGIFLAPGIVIGTSLMIHQCNKCNVAMCLFHSPSIY